MGLRTLTNSAAAAVRLVAPPAIKSATRRSVAVSSLPDRSATTRGSSHSISASSGPVSHLGGQVAGSPQGGGKRAFPPDSALIADPDFPSGRPGGIDDHDLRGHLGEAAAETDWPGRHPAGGQHAVAS